MSDGVVTVSTVSERSLASRAVGGAVVTMLGQGARVVIQFSIIVLLARLLNPHDYGLMAMVTAIVGVADILRDFGLSSAAIQAKQITNAQRDNLFWINSAIGLALSLVVFVAAQVIADFYREPALVTITQVLAINFLLNGMATQYRANLSREMRFGQLALSDIGAQVLGLLVGVGVALVGWGVWALVLQQVVQAVANLVIAMVCARWLPGGYRRGVPMGSFLSFGWNLMVAQLLSYANRSVGQVIIGYRLGPNVLGLYNRAFQLLMMPLNQVIAPASSVALPVLSQLQDDRARFDSFLLRGQTMMLHVIVPLFAFACAQATPLIVLVLGEKWRSAVLLFQILTLAGMTQSASYASYWLFLARGLIRDHLLFSIVSHVFLVLCVCIGAYWGVFGVAIGYSISLALIWPLSIIWAARITPVPGWEIFFNGMRAIVGYGVCAFASMYASQWCDESNLWKQLIVGALAMLVVFAVLSLLWPAFRRDVLSIIKIGMSSSAVSSFLPRIMRRVRKGS
ncbi:lipopolysaccharide biosynthesis protein [Xylella fastidiosa subsp. morus]|uniref:lipopolysaccharide biosynthesis protein n=1 Tax=Xylella fastidiosa TaxID=2371 RepID=UPI0003ED0BB9|nr:lipopolysaccharide biosynthesis protein [Xylella fastidiosa]AIC12657.1 GumJ protein [Xylella fastidiosa MUL0034]EWG15262.1 polysaccharide biosynthesis protein [Xylella fastidiosa Mul-MD]UIN28705.1 lipopolysaccharide biosynthesis protein [Xylella fastidiosa subsp. morus]UIT37446.1 lipopolysaccharide biosynthesis protein [Xylella fastidiosa subsp. morus]UIT39740.1 lipopolysaccharide biosynthesis protein [Xylella fastidiosa subsp. morus]